MEENRSNQKAKVTFKSSLKTRGISPKQALDLIEEELGEDGLMEYDLGSYTTIEMLSEADFIIHNLLGKNMINQNEYAKTTKIHENLVKTIGGFLNAPEVNRVFGSSTSGSSEAVFLGILAAKWYWKKRKPKGIPNIVLCNTAHLCWYKFAKYLDIEVREVPLESINTYPLEEIESQINENTICVVAVLGCTYLGLCDPIDSLNLMVRKLNKENNWDVGIHVDAAIGGFIVPFMDTFKQKWDFRLSEVKSINLSGHKYGLVYPGLGWILFKDEEYFPRELSLNSEYLSGSFSSFTVNFSRSSSLVIAQYFNFLHYGMEGYRKVIEKCVKNARLLIDLLEETKLFTLLSKDLLPVVVFAFKKEPTFSEEEFTKHLRKRNWMLPYYQLPKNLNQTAMRVVVRNDTKEITVVQLVRDLVACYEELERVSKRE